MVKFYIVGILLMSSAASASIQQTPYRSQLIGTPGAFTGSALNDVGEVFGFYSDNGLASVSRWSAGSGIQELGWEGLTNDANRLGAVKFLGDAGVVAGVRYTPAGDMAGSFVGTPDRTYELTPPSGFDYAFVRDVNRNGTAVGVLYDSSIRATAFKWSAETGFEVLSGYTDAKAISDDGRVAAQTYENRTYILSGAGSTLLPIPADFSISSAAGFNDSGDLAGRVVGTGSVQAALWSIDGTFELLGDVPGGPQVSYPFGVNESDVVWGLATTAKGNVPFLWHRDVGIFAPSLYIKGGWKNVSIQSVNASGQVLVHADRNGVGAAFLLTPAATGDVPEPETWSLFILGFGLIGGGLRIEKRWRVSSNYRATRIVRAKT